jgi:uncharacterized membrane protein
MDYVTVKWLNILSSTLLFGTGIGSAFYMLLTSLSRDVRSIAVVVRFVVIADWLFTTPTAFIQPLTGFYMMRLAGMPMRTHWIEWSLLLYVIAIACWLPVVVIQVKMRDLAQAARREERTLPAAYWRFLYWWIGLGSVAFVAFLMIFYLMVAKPVG